VTLGTVKKKEGWTETDLTERQEGGTKREVKSVEGGTMRKLNTTLRGRRRDKAKPAPARP